MKLEFVYEFDNNYQWITRIANIGSDYLGPLMNDINL